MLANVVLIIFWICFGFIVVRGRTLGSEGGASDRASRLKCKSPASNGPVPTWDILDLLYVFVGVDNDPVWEERPDTADRGDYLNVRSILERVGVRTDVEVVVEE